MLLPLMQHVTSAPTGRPLSVSSRGSWQYFSQQESTVLALLDNLYHVTQTQKPRLLQTMNNFPFRVFFFFFSSAHVLEST